MELFILKMNYFNSIIFIFSASYIELSYFSDRKTIKY